MQKSSLTDSLQEKNESRSDSTIAVGDPADLTRLWSLLIARRRWFFLGFGACLIAAIGYLVTAVPVYEARVKLRVGQAAGAGLLEPTEVVASRLLLAYGEDATANLRTGATNVSFLKDAKPSRTTPALLDLVAQGPTRESAQKFVQSLATEVVSSHRTLYEQLVRSISDRISSIPREIEQLQAQYDELSGVLERITQTDPVQASVVVLNRGRLMDSMISLETERLAIIPKVFPPQSQKTEIIGEAHGSVRPVSPRYLTVLGLGLTAGLLSGVALALIAESVTALRRFT